MKLATYKHRFGDFEITRCTRSNSKSWFEFIYPRKSRRKTLRYKVMKLEANEVISCNQRNHNIRLLKLVISLLFRSVNVSQSTLAKPEFRLEMLVGSCTAWSMEFSLMARCRVTRLSAEETIPSTRFSAKQERENTFLALCSLTWNQLLLVSKQKKTVESQGNRSFRQRVVSPTVSSQTCWVDSQTSDSRFANLIYYAYSVLFSRLK